MCVWGGGGGGGIVQYSTNDLDAMSRFRTTKRNLAQPGAKTTGGGGGGGERDKRKSGRKKKTKAMKVVWREDARAH